MEIVEFILRDTAWLVGILVGITTLIKNLKDLKGDKNKKRRSPAKKKRRK
ncbi:MULTISPECIES: hypothetical protein [Bacillus]|nr:MULTISPECIES: hypothetical protein [Bacillus]MBL3625874.1 hypothetical protein [Bacillus sp. RHF6]MEC1896434.1 hypothetical protein [Bacillus velezensis]MEC1917611.1 hypothetical protein [Bacillus velezensis]SLB57812.1 Uncharacterised protein [Mycobacteroides abscessus subsp. massiliense]